MRITPKAKIATRQRILDAATDLFKNEGWHNATTRDIAVAAGIATGTLFNYFATKEAIAATLIAEAVRRLEGDEFPTGQIEESTLEASLFTLIWYELSKLREYRSFLASASEVLFSPLARPSEARAGDVIRVAHLEKVETLVTACGFLGPLSAVSVQIYWTLYLGVFAFWAADESPGQEDTLALLDQSLRLFVSTLGMEQGRGTNGRQ